MGQVAMPARSEPRDSRPGEGGGRQPKAPARPVGEIIADLQRERTQLVEAIGQLKAEGQATRKRLLSPASLAAAGGAVVGFIFLRRLRKR